VAPPLLDVPVHLQDDPRWCGLACVQMIDRFLNGVIVDQSNFAGTIGQNPGWDTDPTQLVAWLNQIRPAGSPPYAVFAKSTAKAAMDHATAGLAAGMPSVGLTLAGGHWEVVQGYTSGSKGMVHARDPFPDRILAYQVLHAGANPTSPLPYHTDTDDCGVENTQFGGLSDEVVTWGAWTDAFFTKCTISQGGWTGEYVVVAPDIDVEPAKSATQKRSNAEPVDEASAGARAWQAIDEYGLTGLRAWADALQSARGAGPYRTLRVDRIDRSQSYYLVAVTDARARGALVGIGAADGDLLWARLNPWPSLLRGLFTAPPVGPGTRIVWKPAMQARSPFFPLLEVTVAKAAPYYIRLFDKRRFIDLADLDAVD